MKLILSDNIKFSIIAMVTLIAVNFWSFQLLDEKQFDVLEFGACLLLFAVVFYNSGVFLKRNMHFKSTVLLFIFLPLLSVVGAYAYHDQAMNLSLLLLRTNLYWLLYFVLHIFNVSKEKVLKLLIFIGCGWAFLTIVQQFTYPHAYFYTRGEGNAGLYRGNLIRLMPSGQQYGVFMLLYFFYKYLTTKKLDTLLFVGLALGGLYYYGTRQVAATAVACMLVAVLLLKGISKWGYILLFSAIGFLVVVIIQPTMIAHYMELTSTQLNNEDYIRYRAMDFYLNDYWPSWGAKLLGNGKHHILSSYGVEMQYITKELGLWRSDVGIIGTYNTFGLFFVLNIIWVSIKGIFLKFPSDKDKYLKLLFVYPTLQLPLNVGYTHGAGMCFFCLVFYLVDIALSEEKETEDKVNVETVAYNGQLVETAV